MKIAITSKGKDLNSEVDPRFGRTAWFLVIDTESGEYEALDNQQNMSSAQGAGIQAGEKVASAGVDAVLTGHCGPKAFRTLNAAGIKIFVGVGGTVEDALNDFKAGKYNETERPDVQGHWM